MSGLVRYWLWDGDESSTGGVAKGSCDRSTSTTESGAKLNAVVEGDEVFCPACKTVGYIKHIPPFRSMNIQIGNVFKRQCLDGDLCICKCATPPVMKAIHKRGQSTFEASEIAAMAGSILWLARAGHMTEEHEIFYEIVDAKTNSPIESMSYKLTSGNKMLVDGQKLSSGKSQPQLINDHPNLNFVAWVNGRTR